MDGAKVGVFEEVHKVGLCGFLKGLQSLTLPSEVLPMWAITQANFTALELSVM